jgi:uncharacterized protein YbbC (DUF1343 family)
MHTGLDRLATSADLATKLRGSRVALLAHPASVTRELVHVSEVLAQIGVRPTIVFGPEHGYGGEAQDMVGVADARDARGVPIRSLYGHRFEDLSPRESDLDGLDVMVIDLADVGARYYTFIWTAVLAMRACVRKGVRVLVLDRPNPLGAEDRSVEGRCQKPRFCSFVGLEPIPIRHALTLGAIVAWRADVEKVPDAQLEVVRVLGLDPRAHAPDWDRPFVMPSPNMPTYETALVYPGGCLVEGTNLSEGRGTTRPFEIVGAPWIDGARLARDLNALGLPGVRARPVVFRPTFHKFAGEVCGGVEVHATQPRELRPVRTYVALVALAHHQAPERFRFRTERYEFVDDIPAFDLLTGDSSAREAIDAGASPAEVADSIAPIAQIPQRDRENELAIVRAAQSARRRRSI